MNGQRTNQLVAPTSFITSTSRRRAKMESRIVLPISSTAAMPSTTAMPAITASITPAVDSTLSAAWRRSRGSAGCRTVGSSPFMPATDDAIAALWSGSFAFTSKRAGNGLPARNWMVPAENFFLASASACSFVTNLMLLRLDARVGREARADGGALRILGVVGRPRP